MHGNQATTSRLAVWPGRWSGTKEMAARANGAKRLSPVRAKPLREPGEQRQQPIEAYGSSFAFAHNNNSTDERDIPVPDAQVDIHAAHSVPRLVRSCWAELTNRCERPNDLSPSFAARCRSKRSRGTFRHCHRSSNAGGHDASRPL